MSKSASSSDLRPLGASPPASWRVSADHADLVRPLRCPLPAQVKAQPKPITIDLARTAMIVVDMQNDFCHADGWLASIGVDVAPARKPIAPLNAFLPRLRAACVPIIWLNWGARPDRLNLSPALLHVCCVPCAKHATAAHARNADTSLRCARAWAGADYYSGGIQGNVN